MIVRSEHVNDFAVFLTSIAAFQFIVLLLKVYTPIQQEIGWGYSVIHSCKWKCCFVLPVSFLVLFGFLGHSYTCIPVSLIQCAYTSAAAFLHQLLLGPFMFLQLCGKCCSVSFFICLVGLVFLLAFFCCCSFSPLLIPSDLPIFFFFNFFLHLRVSFSYTCYKQSLHANCMVLS